MARYNIEDHFVSVVQEIRYHPYAVHDKYSPHIAGTPISFDGEEMIRSEVKVLNNNKELIRDLENTQGLLKTCSPYDQYWSIHENQLTLATYCLYVCYCAIVWEEDVEHDFSAIYSYIQTATDDKTSQCVWTYIEMFQGRYSDLFSFRLTKGRTTVHFVCGTKRRALASQMLLHIFAGPDRIETASHYVCKQCKQMFIRHHKNNVYCKECGTNAACSRRKRKKQQRQREEEQHGETPAE